MLAATAVHAGRFWRTRSQARCEQYGVQLFRKWRRACSTLGQSARENRSPFANDASNISTITSKTFSVKFSIIQCWFHSSSGPTNDRKRIVSCVFFLFFELAYTECAQRLIFAFFYGNTTTIVRIYHHLDEISQFHSDYARVRGFFRRFFAFLLRNVTLKIHNQKTKQHSHNAYNNKRGVRILAK